MRGLSSALKFSQNQAGKSPSSVAPAVLTHAEAVEHNYRLVLDPDQWAENGERRQLLMNQTERFASVLERSGVQARLDRHVAALGAVTGACDWVEGFRNSNVLPLVASRNRRTVLRDLQYWLMHVSKHPVHYAVFTFGQNVEIFGDLRDRYQEYHRRLSKLAHWAKKKYGVHFVGRFDEATVRLDLSFHPHANVLFWQTRKMPQARWSQFLEECGKRFGAWWHKSPGVVRDASEIVKYFAKGDDLSLLADMACQVPQWADRYVPQAAVVEAMAYKIASERSEKEKRRVTADECKGFAVRAVVDGVAKLRAWAEEGKPHPLVWLFHEMHGLHLCQSMGDLKCFRRELKDDGRKIAFVTKDGGSPFLVQVKKEECPADRRDEEDATEREPDAPLIVENRILAVTMPQPRFSPWAEPVILIENFNANPRTDSGALGLWRIQQIRDKARLRWLAAGSPDPDHALAVAASVRSEDRQGGPRAVRGGFLPGLDAGNGDGEADAVPYGSHHNENCPEQNSRRGYHVLGDGTIVDRDDGRIVYRHPSYDDLCRILDVEGAIRRASEVDPPQRSLWWKLRNYEIWRSEQKNSLNSGVTEWPEGHFINIDDMNFFDVEGEWGECDIPF